MASKKYLYGEVSGTAAADTPQASIAKVSYSGEANTSLKLPTNNEGVIMVGENIPWTDMLGVTEDKAYPGNLGDRNYQKILELTTQLNNEIAIAEEARRDTLIVCAVNKRRVEALQGKFDSKNSEVEDEFDNLSEQITMANTRLSAAVAQLNEKDSQLASDISKVNKRIQSETTKLSQVDNDLLNQLLNEVTRSIQAENNLLLQLQEEVTARTDIDDELKARLDTLAGVSTETVESVKSQLEALQTRLNSEVRSLTTQLEEVSDNVEEEINRLVRVDTDLQSQIENIDQRIDGKFIPIVPNNGMTYDVYAVNGNDVITINATSQAEPRSIVRRNSLGHISVDGDIETLGDSDAVPKYYIEEMIEDQLTKLYNKIEFIDGGNAPVK